MKTKSKWSGVVMVLLALVLALGAALTAAPVREPPEAEAGALAWGTVEGDYPTHGIPTGVGQIIDITVTGNTVFVLADSDGNLAWAARDGVIQVVRSDDGGYRWETPMNIALTNVGDVGIAIEVSSAYASDGTVAVLVREMPGGVNTGGRVYTSTTRGVTWPAGLTSALVGLATDIVNTMALTPNFNGLLTGGTVVVGLRWVNVATASTVYYASWMGPGTGWSVWTATTTVGGGPAVGDSVLAIATPPQNALYMNVVQQDSATFNIFAQSVLITGPFLTWVAAVAAGQNVYLDAALYDTATAVIAIPADYNPVGAAPAPLQFFVGTDDNVGANNNGSVWFYDTAAAAWTDAKGVTIPANHRDTSGLISTGNYLRATLVVGCANVPITYNYDVRSQAWGSVVWVEGTGGPIGTLSNSVGVLLDYTGAGNTIYGATSDLATAYTVGDLTGLHRSDDFAASWSDTCLTSENFRQNVLDMVWLDALTGIIVADDASASQATAPTNVESVFKTWDQGISWKRVDRWVDVTAIAVGPDGTIAILNTGVTGTKVRISNDRGDTFTSTTADVTTPVTKVMSAIAVGSYTDIVVGDNMGHIYYTGNGGTSWTDVGAVGAFVHSLQVPDDYATVSHVAAGMTSSAGLMEIFLSTDRGASWTQVGNSTQVGAWGVGVTYIGTAYSGTYVTDSLLYVNTVGAAVNDIYRTDTSGDLATAGWMPLRGAGWVIAAIEVVYYAPLDGVEGYTGNILYATDTAAGGAIRTTYYPESVNWQSPAVGLWDALPADAASLWTRNGVLDAIVGSSVSLFGVDVNAAAPDLVRSWTATTGYLTPTDLFSPAAGAIVPSNDWAAGEPVELQWNPVIGAVTYDVFVATQPSRLYAVWANNVGTTEDSVVRGTLADGQTYYWQVRVSSTVVAPAAGGYTGPYCDWQTFTVEAVELHVAPTLISPTSGAVDVGVRPLVRWSGIQDVTGYLLQVDDDHAFGSPVIDETLGAQQTYQPAADLAWETTYSWRVKGIGADWESPWAESIFTTMPEWMAPAPAVTPVWVWILIVLGAIVAIVVLMLIMRMRPKV